MAAAAAAHPATPSLLARTLRVAYGATGALAGVCQELQRMPGLLLTRGQLSRLQAVVELAYLPAVQWDLLQRL